MGKSLDNYIAMTAPAKDMFGKLMSLPDPTMRSYFDALTEVSNEELDEFDHKIAEGTLNPRDVKLRMAREIVTEFHDTAAAEEAEEAFIRQFSERKLPVDIPDYHLSTPKNIVELMVEAKLAGSNNKARELIKQGGVSLFLKGEVGEAQRITDIDFTVDVIDGAVLKVGKRQYLRIKA
jgi:tyrosyl-tRNA synthetase